MNNNIDVSKEILSNITVYMKYAKFIPELNRRENWYELVKRNEDMHLKKFPQLKDEINSAYRYVYEKKILPSMRSIQFAGKPIELNNSRLYNCFSKDTTFVTSEGIKSFNDFNDNDSISVLTHKGNWKTAIVRNYGKQELNEITITKGRNHQKIRATQNHRWILKDGTYTTNLSVGDKLLNAPAIFDAFDYDNASPFERLYWAYGYVFGDGTKIKSNGKNYDYSMVRLCGDDKNKYYNRFEELGFSSSSSLSLNGDCIFYTGKYLKTYPDPKIDSPELIRAFVAGYLDADGGKNRSQTSLSKYNDIVASDEDHQYVIENLFSIAGITIFNIMDISGQETNYGIRKNAKRYSISTNLSSKTNSVFSVKEIKKSTFEEVWCLEVEDDHSFVLSGGISTGNCSFAPVDSIEAFSEIMFLLLSGCGVGYSVQNHHIEKLPPITKPTKTRRYLVGDSIEGWSDAIKMLVKAYFSGKPLPDFDFNDVRQKGSLLITAGGRAPGPEPLKDCIHHIKKILDRKENGDQLTSLEAHDIICFIADAVLSGGIRRAAMIALFDIDDDDMLTCKFNDWYVENPQRGRANNSAVIVRHMISEEVFKELWKKIELSGSGEPGFFFTNDPNWGLNPCAEISLRPFQFCNLVTINAGNIENQEDLNQRAVAASFIATLQASYTNFHYLRDIWKRTTEKEALIGVSMTGIASGAVNDLSLKEAAGLVKQENARVAELIGIKPAARQTTIKPEGCLSLDTKIKTSDGILSMAEVVGQLTDHNIFELNSGTWLEPQKQLYVYDENDEKQLVTKLYVNGISPLYEIVMEDETIVKLTENHMLKTINGWKKAKDLIEDDEILSW